MEIVEVKENPTPAENPANGWKNLAGDVVLLGFGAAGTHLGMEYVSAQALAAVAEADKKNAGYGIGVGKYIAGTVIYFLTAKYVDHKYLGKLLYGVGTGMFTSGTTDIVEAYNL